MASLFERVAKPFVRSPLTPQRVARLLRAGSLHEAVSDKVVMITGASSGIGHAAAVRVGAAGGTVLLVSRTREKLEQTQAEVAERGGQSHVHPCDLSDLEDIDRMAAEVLAQHGRVDVLVNNAGRSIRRSIAYSYDRMHDFQRTMQLNYFGPVKLILDLLPGMRERKDGHIINISSGGVQVNAPRFSAYVASKAALDAFAACIAAEIHDDNVRITTIYMPLVRTPMIEPTKFYRSIPALDPKEAAEMIAEAIVTRPKRVAAAAPSLVELAYTASPGSVDAVANMAYHLFPDSRAARGEQSPEQLSGRARLFARVLRGPHW
jgi:NAD(P)-dependent dehydrogenase (short-subunit alcohol dehydrogenase family)